MSDSFLVSEEISFKEIRRALQGNLQLCSIFLSENFTFMQNISYTEIGLGINNFSVDQCYSYY